jgi:hypothetical protein
MSKICKEKLCNPQYKAKNFRVPRVPLRFVRTTTLPGWGVESAANKLMDNEFIQKFSRSTLTSVWEHNNASLNTRVQSSKQYTIFLHILNWRPTWNFIEYILCWEVDVSPFIIIWPYRNMLLNSKALKKICWNLYLNICALTFQLQQLLSHFNQIIFWAGENSMIKSWGSLLLTAPLDVL